MRKGAAGIVKYVCSSFIRINWKLFDDKKFKYYLKISTKIKDGDLFDI